jgi:hypothetical protein
VSDEECNTCGDTGRWITTFEDEPDVLTDIGPCPDCELGEFHPIWSPDRMAG